MVVAPQPTCPGEPLPPLRAQPTFLSGCPPRLHAGPRSVSIRQPSVPCGLILTLEMRERCRLAKKCVRPAEFFFNWTPWTLVWVYTWKRLSKRIFFLSDEEICSAYGRELLAIRNTVPPPNFSLVRGLDGAGRRLFPQIWVSFPPSTCPALRHRPGCWSFSFIFFSFFSHSFSYCVMVSLWPIFQRKIIK